MELVKCVRAVLAIGREREKHYITIGPAHLGRASHPVTVFAEDSPENSFLISAHFNSIRCYKASILHSLKSSRSLPPPGSRMPSSALHLSATGPCSNLPRTVGHRHHRSQCNNVTLQKRSKVCRISSFARTPLKTVDARCTFAQILRVQASVHFLSQY